MTHKLYGFCELLSLQFTLILVQTFVAFHYNQYKDKNPLFIINPTFFFYFIFKFKHPL